MVDGVHGHVDHAVQHVVEQSNVVENAIVLYLPVEEMVVLLAQVLNYNIVLLLLVRS